MKCDYHCSNKGKYYRKAQRKAADCLGGGNPTFYTDQLQFPTYIT